MQTKTELRNRIMQKRSELAGSEEMRAQSGLLTARLLDSEPFKQSTAVAGYLSLEGEFDTTTLQIACFAHHKRWIVPAWDAELKEYRATEMQVDDELVAGPFRVLEPLKKRWCAWAEADLVLVPGLAFDTLGNRVGFGRGFYDRILALCSQGALRVAPIFEWQVFEEVPAEEHDMAVDVLVTETRWLSTGHHNEESRTEKSRLL